MYKFFISILALIYSTSCVTKITCPPFNTSDLEWMPYHEGDTLFFENGKKYEKYIVSSYKVYYNKNYPSNIKCCGCNNKIELSIISINDSLSIRMLYNNSLNREEGLSLPMIICNNASYKADKTNSLPSFHQMNTPNVMSKSENPLFSIPQYKIVITYPSASPNNLDELVVQPIESALKELIELEFIKSQIRDGIAVIQIKFTQNAYEDKQLDKVQQVVNRIQPRLPSGVRSVSVDQVSIDDTNILQYNLISKGNSYHEKDDTGYSIKDNRTVPDNFIIRKGMGIIAFNKEDKEWKLKEHRKNHALESIQIIKEDYR